MSGDDGLVGEAGEVGETEQQREPETDPAPAEVTPTARARRRGFSGWVESDAVRSWLSLAAPFLVVAAIFFGSRETTTRDGGLIVISLVAVVVQTVVLSGLTLVAFGRAGGADLRDGVLSYVRRQGTGDRRKQWLLDAGSAPMWAVQLAVLSLFYAGILAVVPQFRDYALVMPLVIAFLASNVLSMWIGYAVHYARIDARSGGLDWPGGPEKERRFVDYLYLSGLVQISYSTSDVAVTTSGMRRAVLAHGALGFLFNTVVIAILISVLISIGGG